jgi:hypothetical protein
MTTTWKRIPEGNEAKSMFSICRRLAGAGSCRWAALATYLVAVSSAAIYADTQVGQPGDGAADTETIYRLDPVLDELLPVPREEQRAGHIYLHYSQRLGRRVWSFRLANGRFWHAFGEGTVQPARLFDVRRTREESLELLGPGRAALRDELRRTGGAAMLRLGENGRWTPAHVGSAPTIYDSQTRRLWQLGASDYIPVSHSPFGYLWTRSAGRFVPSHGTEGAQSQPAFLSECGR